MGPPIMERQTPMLPQNTAAENNDVRYMHPAAAFFHCAGKNVTGRLLVGLRWWNDVDERGESTWKFESLNQQALDRINRNDSWIFWWSLYINNAAWVALAIIAIVKLNFDYLIITIIAISLTSANTAGYSKCRKDAERRANAGGQGFASSLFQAARGVRNMVWLNKESEPPQRIYSPTDRNINFYRLKKGYFREVIQAPERIFGKRSHHW